MTYQDMLMEFDPATGKRRPYPSHAEQWRLYHGQSTAWLYNPWSGQRRNAQDVGSDTQGLLIQSGSPRGRLGDPSGGAANIINNACGGDEAVSDWLLCLVTPFPWVAAFILIDVAEQLFSRKVKP